MIYKFTNKPDTINWYRLSRTVLNIELALTDYTEPELTYKEIDENQLILRKLVEIDYEKIFEKAVKNTSVFKEELIAKAFHPSRIVKWLELGWDPTDEVYETV